MNTPLCGLVVGFGLTWLTLPLVAQPTAYSASSVETDATERPPIFAAKPADDGAKEAVTPAPRAPRLSSMVKRQITEQVLSDLRATTARDEGERYARPPAEPLLPSVEDEVVVLDRYTVRSSPLPELEVPKNRLLERIRTGNLHRSAGGKLSVDLLGSSVSQGTFGDSGQPRLTLGITVLF